MKKSLLLCLVLAACAEKPDVPAETWELYYSCLDERAIGKRQYATEADRRWCWQESRKELRGLGA